MLTFLCEEAAAADNKWMTWVFVGLLVVLVAALLIVPMFTNKKRAKQDNERYNSLRPGDVIKTVGGIIGTIIEIRQVSPTEKEIVLETGIGDNKTTMVFDIQALYQIVSKVSEPAVAAPETVEQPSAETDNVASTETAEVSTAEEPSAAVEEKTEPVDDFIAAAQAADAEQVATDTTDESVASIETETAVTEKPAVEKAPAKKSAGKSTHAAKSTSAGKKPAKK